MRHAFIFARFLTVMVALLLVSPALHCVQAAATESEEVPVVAKWERFEHTFRSAIKYQQPYEGVKLDVTFTSPRDQTRTVRAFWDGERTWRVRFAPDLPGVWKFASVCSDEENEGLHGVRGEFLCTTASGENRFRRHGPVRRAREGVHLDHHDGTPFLWLADTVWLGGGASTEEDWTFYANVRARQGFSAAQWIALSGAHSTRTPAFGGGPDRRINPAYFQQLDQKVEILNRAGLLSAMAPFAGLPTGGRHPLDVFSEDEAIRLLQHLLARWHADQVAWVLPCEADGLGERAMQWQRIGRAAFGEESSALVILNPGETYWAAQALRTEPWVDAIGYQTGQSLSDDSLQWLIAGPFTQEWRNPSPLTVLNLAPVHENGLTDSAGKRARADEVRRILYTSLLSSPPAGVSYGAQGVWDWNEFVEPDETSSAHSELPVWKKALFMPAARQIGHLMEAFAQFDWWRLRPAPGIMLKQPGSNAPSRYIAAARSAEGDLTVIYVPEDRTVEVSIDALPPAPKIQWHQPATGKTSPAVAVIGGRSCQFPTPEPGDWLLVMKTESKPANSRNP